MNRALPPLGLYLHMPWCVRKCPYCDFNSHALRTSVPDPEYIDVLLKDLETELPLIGDRPIETVFFGGGTPSLFAPPEIARLLEGVRARVRFVPGAEVTLEANPGTIERGRFAAYREAGITRVSLGAQSFDARSLQELGRIHGPEDTIAAARELNEAGLQNFNLDLMYALPGQTLDGALADLEAAIALNPAHISYYHLTLEPGTVFHARPPPLPDEDLAWEMQLAGQQRLGDAGFQQYEVSAYAKEGASCRHNLNYWTFGDYVGLGAGAHGKITRALPGEVMRSAKIRQPREFMRAVLAGEASGERHAVASEDLPFEFLLNALRLNAGFSAAQFESRTGLALASIEKPLETARQRGLLALFASEEGPLWAPTALGRRFLNDLQALFLQ